MVKMIFLYSFLALYALWFFYLAVMCLKRADDAGTISKQAYILGLPILIIGVLLDWAVNMTLGTVVFLDMPESPKELVTGRLKRYVERHPDTWRATASEWFAVHFLDVFDPSGKHI